MANDGNVSFSIMVKDISEAVKDLTKTTNVLNDIVSKDFKQIGEGVEKIGRASRGIVNDLTRAASSITQETQTLANIYNDQISQAVNRMARATSQSINLTMDEKVANILRGTNEDIINTSDHLVRSTEKIVKVLNGKLLRNMESIIEASKSIPENNSGFSFVKDKQTPLSDIEFTGEVLGDGFNYTPLNDVDFIEPIKDIGEIGPFKKFRNGIQNIKNDIKNFFKTLRGEGDDVGKDQKPEDTLLGKIVGLAGKGYIMKKALDFIKNLASRANDFLRTSLQIASDTEETQNVVNKAFAGSQDIIEDFANNSIRNLGITSLKAKQYASTYKSMMNGIKGITEETKTDLSMMLTGLAADVGSFFSATLSTDEAFEVLKAPLDKQSLKLARLGVNMTQEALKDWSVDFGIDYDKLSQSEQALVRISYVADALKITSGDFIKNQNSWHNQLELITNKFSQLKDSFGSFFIDLLKPMLEFSNFILDNILDRVDFLLDKLYSIFGIERTIQEEAPDTPQPTGEDLGFLFEDDTSTPDREKEEDKGSKEPELSTLSFDNLETLKTDYSDKESKKTRDVVVDQSSKVNALLERVQRERDAAVKKALDEHRTELSDSTIKIVDKLTIIWESLEPYLEPLKDLGVTIIDGIIDTVKGVSRGFIDQFKDLGTGDVIKDIINELNNIAGNIFGALNTEHGDDEQFSLAETIGKIIATILHLQLVKISIILKGVSFITEILEELGIMKYLLIGINTLIDGISYVINLAYEVISTLLDRSKLAQKTGEIKEGIDKKRRKALEEGDALGYVGNTFKAAGLFAGSNILDIPHKISSLLRGEKGKTPLYDTYFTDSIQLAPSQIGGYNLTPAQQKQGDKTGGTGDSGDIIKNDIYIDGKKIQEHTDKVRRRNRRITGE